MVESIHDDGDFHSELLWVAGPPVSDESEQDLMS